MAFEFKPFSPKQLDAIFNSDAFINIYEGAVRSGKTIASIVAWINFIQESKHGKFLMTGKTTDTLYQNVIEDIEKIFGTKRARYVKSAKGGARLVLKFPNPDYPARSRKKIIEKICYCRGANDEKAEGKIRGMTVAGWYADEVTLYPQSFITQAMNRMSLSGARAYWTTNPDSPFHFIKTDFIDEAAEKGFKSWHFELDDNLALDERYKEHIKKAYKGLWYQRMILGLWVMADGVVYDMFDSDVHVVDVLPKMKKTWISCDYGTSNATTFILAGLGTDDRLYIIDEYYHSGRTSKQKSPSQYADDMVDWLHKHDDYTPLLEWIWIDPSAEGFILELYHRRAKHPKLNKIAQADNNVKRGIELVSSIMGNDLFRVNRKCKHVLQELTSYIWDVKAQERGEDVPVKQNDHTLDPVRYIANGTRLIWYKKGVTKQAA